MLCGPFQGHIVANRWLLRGKCLIKGTKTVLLGSEMICWLPVFETDKVDLFLLSNSPPMSFCYLLWHRSITFHWIFRCEKDGDLTVLLHIRFHINMLYVLVYVCEISSKPKRGLWGVICLGFWGQKVKFKESRNKSHQEEYQPAAVCVFVTVSDLQIF